MEALLTSICASNLFSAKFLENIVIALDSKISILDSNFVGYGVACKVF